MHLDVSAEQRVEHLGVALERHVHEVGAGHGLEHLGRQMRRGAGAGGGVVETRGLRFGIFDELLDVVHRQRVVHHQHQRDRRDLRDRDEILHGVIRLLLQAGVDRECDRGDHQHMAVGRGLCHQIGADTAAAARTIVDDGRLPPAIGQPLRDEPRDRVGGAAGDERHHQLDLPARIGLRGGGTCGEDCSRQRSRRAHGHQAGRTLPLTVVRSISRRSVEGKSRRACDEQRLSHNNRSPTCQTCS